jgi:hypothetical protein
MAARGVALERHVPKRDGSAADARICESAAPFEISEPSAAFF